MKKYILSFLFIVCFITGQAMPFDNVPKEKTAILMVHFGTTFDDTRSLTIDAINEKAKQAFPGVTVREAYTSRIIIKRLKERGISKPTPIEALLRLAADGYTHVIVQGTNVIDGIEAEVLRKDASEMAPFFKEIRVGRPLLYSVDDCQKVVGIMKELYCDNLSKSEAAVFIGHGTSTPANAMYSQIDYMFKSAGSARAFVATVEGYPTFETTLSRLKERKIRKVTLLPFMFVAGDHARNDIDVEWKESLQAEGYEVQTIIKGLGQIPSIQDIYIDHIKDAFNSPVFDAAGQKTKYINDNL